MNTLRLATLAALALTTSTFAAFPTLFLKNVCDDQLHAPTNITNAHDGSGRLFICDQPGKVYIFQGGMLNPSPFLDLSSKVVTVSPVTSYSERGLLGMCFHPGFSTPSSPGYRCFYVNYTAPSTQPTLNPVGSGGSTNAVSVIAEYKVSTTNPDVADTSTERIVLTYGQPQNNHNGGQLEFGPDGYLYIATGDGGGANDNPSGHTQGSGSASAGRVSGTLGNGQDRRQLLGKILRIDPLGTNGPGGTYGIPASNPFVGQTQDFTDNSLDGPMRGEIYSYGMRNPWRFCFDSSFGGAARMICADVGQLDVEEIDFITSGGNYGWRMKEGTADFDTVSAYGGSPPATIAPIAQYTHPTTTLPGLSPSAITGTSITGGYVYRGSAIPALQGKYLFGDYAVNGIGGGGGIFIGLEVTAPGVYTLSNVTMQNPLSVSARIYAFGVDESGEIYVSTKTTSGVQALDPSNAKPAGTIYKIVPVSTVTAALTPSKDNTIYQDYQSNANGKGPDIYSGKIDFDVGGGDYVRRALLRFDLSSIPSNATLQSASLQLTTTRQLNQDVNFTIHKATTDWGEGGSSVSGNSGKGTQAAIGDATWLRKFYNTVSWSTPGGDFVSTPSATAMVGNMIFSPVTTWSGAGVLADVQSWITTPATNFGWVLRGDETFNAGAQRFASRENTTTSQRPKLNITYSVTPVATRFETWYATYYPSNPPGSYLAPTGDEDGDGIANQVEYAFNYSPSTKNAPGAGLTTSRTDDTINTTVGATFRRDPRATDLTYELQSSDDMITWTTIVTSTGGAAPSGDALISDAPISGESPMMLVSASETLPGLEITHFIRLKISRAP